MISINQELENIKKEFAEMIKANDTSKYIEINDKMETWKIKNEVYQAVIAKGTIWEETKNIQFSITKADNVEIKHKHSGYNYWDAYSEKEILNNKDYILSELSKI